MDVQVLHGGLMGREFDNPGFDLPSDFEATIKGDSMTCLPDDPNAFGAPGQISGHAFINGPNGSCCLAQHNITGQGHIPGQSRLSDQNEQRQINELAEQLSQPYGSHQQQEQHRHCQNQQPQHQPQQQQQQQQQQQLQQYSAHHNHQYEHQQHHNSRDHHSHTHHHQQQQQQQQHHQQQQHQQTPSYHSISGQPQLSYDGYDISQLSQTSLLDSPPDSNSEPYSPDGGFTGVQTMTDMKSSIPGVLPSISHSLYMGHTNRLGGIPANKTPPAYVGEPSKHNLHLPAAQQVQQQAQALPIPYPHNAVAMGQPLPHQMLAHPILPAHMGSLPNIAGVAGQSVKKRKFSESPPETISSGMMHGMNGVLNIKQEPPAVQLNSYMSECSGGEDDFTSYELDSNGAFVDSTYQVIKWRHYSQAQWAILTDADLKDLARPQYRVDADKGFNYSTSDEAFVCQKKNHFQVTVHMRLYGNAKYVRTEEGVKQIENFQLHFYGVKMESQNQQIKLEQSQADRSKKSFHPVQVDLTADKDTKVTICRLHFSETTSNNMRKKGKPNPDQRYFLLVVSLHAHSGQHDYMITGSVSDRIIVRASNPAQFDNDVDVMWQRGQNQESVYHVGKVGVNTDHPEEALTVHGNMRLTGALTQPSDKRAKEKIQEIDPRDQLENVSKMRLYTFSYREDYADQVGIPPDNRNDAGVLAQDMLDVLPDAVHDTGDVTLPSGETIENFLVVNKDRIFYENMGAVIELCRVTGKLEGRVDQLEKVNKQLKKLKRYESFKSTASSMSLGSTMSTASDAPSKAPSERRLSATPRPLRENQATASSSQNASKKSPCSTSLKSKTSLISSGSSSTSPSGSSVLGPVKKFSNKQITIVILGLIMALTIIILSTMYILVIRKADDPSQAPVLHDGDPVKNANNHSQLHTTTVSPDVLSTRPSQMTTPPGLTTTTTATQTTAHVRPSHQPVVPPYPRCTQGYCEKLCCPAPHEDRPAIIINHGDGGSDVAYNPRYSVDKGNDIGAPYGEDDEPPVVVSHVIPATENPYLNPGDVDVSIYGGNRFKPNTLGYNVINNLSRQKPHYSVISHTNHRRKRGADDAPRPEIRIVELNYSLTDDFCFNDGCNGNHVYSYYVPLNSSFGYDNITLELRTPTMSHMALCSSHFMWSCPDAPRGNGIDGHNVQQTDVAQWSLRIGNHFRTILNLMVIHSLKGLLVTEPCQLQSNQNYVVMNYTLQFQRTCQ